MIGLLELKEKLKNIYTRYELYLKPIFKFIIVFACMVLIKQNIGYMSLLNLWVVILGLSLIMAFLPWGATVIGLSFVIVANIFSLSPELAALVLMTMVIMLLVFFRFAPKEGILFIIIPFAFFLKIPYIIPVAVGLVCTPVSIVTVTFGTIIYFMLAVISNNSAAIRNIAGESTSSASITSVINMIGSNKEMIVTVLAFIITIIVVYVIRRASINNAWTIAVFVGTGIEFVISLVGSFVLSTDASIIVLIIGTLVSLIIVYLLQFLVFSVDYTRTEHTQFEDDEYYYYVKAVPKINVTAPEMNVKRINAQRRKKK